MYHKTELKGKSALDLLIVSGRKAGVFAALQSPVRITRTKSPSFATNSPPFNHTISLLPVLIFLEETCKLERVVIVPEPNLPGQDGKGIGAIG